MTTFIIALIIILYVAFILYRAIKGKAKGALSCGSDCGSCSSSPICKSDLYKMYKEDQKNKSL